MSIEVKKLSFSYGDRPVLHDISFKVEKGEFVSILGPSGCGKSTLLRTIAGLNHPISGSVTNTDFMPAYMMHQKYTNFDWLSCLDNILIVERKRRKRKESREAAIEVLNKVGLGEYLDRFPTELSGGMQQRLALARVLFARPNVLLMDEPLSALDDNTRAAMQQLILDCHNKTKNTIIMVTHSVDEAHKMCDHIIRLNGGN